jgi:aspartyl/asparaginyl-tRNA synthetase
MKLRDKYGQYIAGKGPVLNVQLPSEISFAKERDPSSIALEKKVNEEMSKALEKALPKENKKMPQLSNKIRIVSYEEAVKELANTLKPTDNKS